MWLNSVWVVWRVSGWCLEGSWMMSGWSLKLQRLYWCTNNYIFSFQCNAPHNAKIDRFGCAWKVSGRCFEDAQSNLDTAWRAILPKQLTKFQWRVPYFEVSLGCLYGVWRCLEVDKSKCKNFDQPAGFFSPIMGVPCALVHYCTLPLFDIWVTRQIIITNSQW